jgi:hypothetical protein
LSGRAKQLPRRCAWVDSRILHGRVLGTPYSSSSIIRVIQEKGRVIQVSKKRGALERQTDESSDNQFLVLFLKYDNSGSIFDLCAPNSGEGRVQRAQQHIVTAERTPHRCCADSAKVRR